MGHFGIAIDECDSCGWVDGAGGRRWRAFVAPVVAAVNNGGPAALACVQLGDILTHVDDVRIDTDEGSRRLAAVRAISLHVLRVQLGGRAVSLRVRTTSIGE